MTRRITPARLALLALLVSPGLAFGYCLETTCNPANPDEECEFDDEGCVLTGVPLRWASSCVLFNVQAAGSEKAGIDAGQATDIASSAFSAWLNADCGGGSPSIRIGTRGPVACDESRYNESGKNANIVIFRDDDWPYAGGADTFGFTFVRFNTTTGEIYDADVEINADRFDIATDGGDEGADLQSILTHEFGHFLGLAHTQTDHDDATMRGNWDGTGVALRYLTKDDASAICETYPPGRSVGTSCEPRHGFSGQCFEPIDALQPPACSSTARVRTSSALGWCAAPWLALALARRRSLRRARRRTGPSRDGDASRTHPINGRRE